MSNNISARELIDSMYKSNTERGRTAISQKDEVAVMKAMINDYDFRTSVYGKDGATGETICPSDCIRTVVSNAIANTTKMPKAEANNLLNDYDFSTKDAECLVDLSKEFVGNYLMTGRKLPLGCRKDSDISLSYRWVPETSKGSPVKSGTDENGNDVWTIKNSMIPAHGSISVQSPCPSYLKNNNK